MGKPILAIMAAGMGSRYGGFKQIEPVDEKNRILIDYSLFDAVRAGFERAVFIVKEERLEDFRAAIGVRVENYMEVSYAFQKQDALPTGYSVPAGRVKPWGTAHAVLAAKDYLDGGFIVINADDFYGEGAFKSAYAFLQNDADEKRHALVGYAVDKTLTENGRVSRGVCKVRGGRLAEITERTQIEKRPGGAAYTEDGETFTFIPGDTVVSMNFWCFKHSMLGEIEARFAPWLETALRQNPLKAEYYIPYTVNEVIKDNAAEFFVLPSTDNWYGITYAEDMPSVREALGKMRREGKYPEKLLD